MIGIFEAGEDGRWVHAWAREAAKFRGNAAQIEFLDVVLFVFQVMLEPELVKFHRFHVDAEASERVEVAVTDPRPVDEFDRELEGALGLAEEIVLVDAEKLVERQNGRNGRFAHADDPDFFRIRSA